MKDAAARRRTTYLRGKRSERIALLWLLLKGYRPLARRFAMAGGEIDLIVQRGATIAFVEVKARADLDVARLAVTPEKRRRFTRAATAWIARNPWAAGRTLRADTIFLAPGRWPQHIPDAFTLAQD